MKIFLVGILTVYASLAWAVQSLSIGAKMDKHPGVSLIAAQSATTNLHVAATIRPGELAAIDVERIEYMLAMMSPKLIGTSFHFRPYFGFGIRGEASPDLELHEAVYLKGTFGSELMSFRSPIQLFLDASPLAGPFPEFKFSALGRIGIRTQF